jgi:hypothetical protein
MSESDDSFSSDSDDEFLTIGDDGEGKVDREAMVRKKLIESFYGKAAVEQAASTTTTAKAKVATSNHHEHHNEQDSKKPAALAQTKRTASAASRSLDNDDDDDSQTMEEMSSGRTPSGKAPSKDLDSPYFDAETYTQDHIMNSSIHTLLETEEKLALQVRTLDSTMQTLVYENYSRFIHATDAIKSISLGVARNEPGLERLLQGMQNIDERSHRVEDALGRLRDEVAEKLRVKRLLTRLDALLKLPTTLQDQIAAGKYRLATQSFLSASSILRKHSTGFESLKTIETECRAILKNMVKQLQIKLRHWSGRKHMNIEEEEEEEEDDEGNHGGETEDNATAAVRSYQIRSSPSPTAVVEPPKGISDIFECAGTLIILLANQQQPDAGADDMDVFLDHTDLCRDDCLSMSLAAAFRLLERRLDAHQIELQEAEFATHTSTATNNSGLDMTMMMLDSKMGLELGGSSHHTSQVVPKGRTLIPTNFLDGVLEAATLYGLSFGNGNVVQDPNERGLLVEFVSEIFASFLGHVRSVLLEQSVSLQLESFPTPKQEDGDGLIDDDGDQAYEEISAAMTLLLHSVRELASGLALPEVGINIDFASNLVDQTIELTEAIVRRRIDQKFYNLRIRVVQECLRDFVHDAFVQPEEGERSLSSLKSTGGDIDRIQLASVALSDCLQLVDDTVRSILSGEAVLGSTASSVDRAMLKEAVQKSTRRFALWLAATLEVLAGCDSSDPEKSILVKDDGKASTEDGDDLIGMTSPRNFQDDLHDSLDKTDPINQRLESAVQDLIVRVEKGSVAVYLELILAMAEMCRLAERSVMENINQSVSMHSGQGKKAKSSGLFPMGSTSSKSKGSSDIDTATSDRFRLAASRVLTLYASNRGADVAAIICSGFLDMARQDGDEAPQGPRAAAWQALEVAKLTAIDCSAVLGGPKRAGPVPQFNEESVIPRHHPSSLSSALLGSGHQFAAIKGLQMDVERMFKEKVTIYPNPYKVIDFSRNAVVTILFKVMVRAMLEHVRMCSFTSMGYRQLLVDIEFLRHMLPHYIGNDYSDDGSNAITILNNLLNDVMNNAGDRCYSLQCVEDESFYFTAQSILYRFMHPTASAKGDDAIDVTERFILEE